jgi:hypothetical protein
MSSHDVVEHSCLSIWRHQMFDWACIVVDSFQIDREVVAIAFSILDRYIAIESQSDYPIEREDFQLFTIVSLYIAAKTSMSFKKLSVEILIDMSRGFYTDEDITLTERDILMALSWAVNPPTVMAFCRLYMQLFPTDLSFAVEGTCQYLSDLATADSYFCSKSNATIALATMLLAARREGIPLNTTEECIENLRGLVNMNNEDFESTFRRLESLC